jgi:hypothetical protein
MFCEYKTKQKTLGILNGEVYSDGVIVNNVFSLNVRETNGLIKSYLETLEKDTVINIKDFKEVYTRVNNLTKDLELLKSLKRVHCGTWNIKEKFDIEVEIAVKEKMLKICPTHLSMVEEAILGEISDDIIYGLPSSRDILDTYYNSVKDDESDINSLENDFKTYDYSVIDFDGDTLIYSLTGKLKEVRDNINAFRMIRDTAGNDLVNWSSHKITRRLNSSDFKVHGWAISAMIQDYCNHLKSKGIEADSTPKKISKAQAAVKKFYKDNNLTQEELILVFKTLNSSRDIHEVMGLLNFESLMEVLNSPLKSIRNKFGDGGVRNTDAQRNTTRLLARIDELLPKKLEKTHLESIVNFSKRKDALESISWNFIIQNYEEIDTNFVMEFARKNKHTFILKSKDDRNIISIPDNVYQKHFSKIPVTEKFRINKAITYDALLRMEDEAKIEWLQKLSDRDAVFDKTITNLVYVGLDWGKVRKQVMKHTDLLKDFVDIIHHNGDKEVAKMALQKWGTVDKDAILLLQVFDNYPSLERIENLIAMQASHLSVDNLNDIYGTKNLVYVLKSLLEVGGRHTKIATDLANFLMTQALSNEGKHTVTKLIEANASNLTEVNFNYKVYEAMDNEVKKNILKSGVKINPQSYYRYDGSLVNDNTQQFFNSLRREDLIECLGEDYRYGIYKLYIGHTLGKEELQELSDRSNDFLRINLDRLTYGYLKQFENKESFKKVVGDQRDRSNKNFAQKLLSKLEVTNTVSFLANL